MRSTGVKVAGSGLCHTDFTVVSRDRGYWKDDPPPFTLGQEIAGWVEELMFQKAIRAPGVGYDRGHAPYVLVPEARFLLTPSR